MPVVFPFGTQYLCGLSPLPGDWELDLARLQALGFTHLRASLVWGVLEPSPGEIDGAAVRTFLDLAQARSLAVIGGFHLRGCPEWASRAQRACWAVDQRGIPCEPQPPSGVPGSGWPGLCPDQAVTQALEEKFIRAIVSQVGRHPALCAWEPMDEPSCGIDLEQTPPGVFCYCDATRAAFRAWVQARYGSTEALSKAWGRRFGSWDDVRPPTSPLGLADWCDWRTFAAENLVGHIRRRTEVIRAYSAAPVIARAAGDGSALCKHLGAMAFDDWKQADGVDLWGCSSFPSKPPDIVSLGLSLDSARGAAGNKPFWQAALGVGDEGGGLDRRGRVPPAWLTLWSWEAIRHGAKGLLYWQFRKERQGAELGAHGLTDYGGEPTASAWAAAAVGQVLNRHADTFLAATPEPAQVAILFSFQSYLVDWAQHRTCQLSTEALAGYYHILWRCNLPVDILHEERLSAAHLARYKLLILPMPTALPAAMPRILTDYVRNGGCLLADPYLCALTPQRQLDTRVPGRELDALFGCREDDICQAAGEVPLTLHDGREGVVRRSRLQASWLPAPGAEILATYADGKAAIVGRRSGAGYAVISGLNLGLGWAPGTGHADDLDPATGNGPHDIAAEVVLDLASDAGLRSPVEAPAGVRASLLNLPDGRAILIALNLQPRPVQGVVKVPHRNLAEAIRLDGAEERSLTVSPGLELDLAGLEAAVILLR